MTWTGSIADWLTTFAGVAAGESRSPVRDNTSQPDSIILLHQALRLARLPPAQLILDVKVPRRAARIDAVLVWDGAVVALCIRMGARTFLAADRAAAEDAALDLADFHAGCRGLPVIPVLVVPHGAHPSPSRPLPVAGAAPVVEANRLLLPGVLRDLAALCPPAGNDPRAWAAAPYRPVPALVAAACALYARHDVPDLLLADAGPSGLQAAAAAVANAVAAAQADGGRIAVFVTGAPGAGKTLCGLNLAFGGAGSAFLTGNPTLVHVLRAALVRDAARRGLDRRAAQRLMSSVIQALPAFRDHYVRHADAPPERLVVIDEAQRCWDATHAVSKTQNRPVPLRDSEPGHLLDAMARHDGWCVLVCLAGGGQEIHDGEGGLAAWGEALACRPGWRAVAAPAAAAAPDPRQRLAAPDTAWDARLHLAAPVRAIGAPGAAAWVDAVMADDPARALGLTQAAGGVPFQVTRSLDAMRRALRQRGRRCGLTGSSGARRLRAEGLGATLLHQDEDAVARWFLDTWPDVRSSDALEVMATEFSVQGLELDRVGVCWDADLVRVRGAWQVRSFRASAWTLPHRAEAVSNRLNAYRVLLTRARHGTIIWVPHGDARDRTRDPALYDGVADYLLACGAGLLDAAALPDEATPSPDPVLL